jgi:hypothetical protein
MAIDTTDVPYLHLEFAPLSPFSKVIDAEGLFHRMVREVGREVTERTDPLQWLIVTAVTNGVIRLRLTARAEKDETPVDTPSRVVHAVVSGVAELTTAASRPTFFNDEALDAIRDRRSCAQTLATSVSSTVSAAPRSRPASSRTSTSSWVQPTRSRDLWRAPSRASTFTTTTDISLSMSA